MSGSRDETRVSGGAVDLSRDVMSRYVKLLAAITSR